MELMQAYEEIFIQVMPDSEISSSDEEGPRAYFAVDPEGNISASSLTKKKFSSTQIKRLKVRSDLKRIRYQQKYRTEWEQLFKDWLAPGPLPTKAACTICEDNMIADLSTIKKHETSKKHCRRSLQNKIKPEAWDSPKDSLHLQKNIQPSALDLPHNNKKYKAECELEFRDRLAPGPLPTKAMSTICKDDMSADFATLKKHETLQKPFGKKFQTAALDSPKDSKLLQRNFHASALDSPEDLFQNLALASSQDAVQHSSRILQNRAVASAEIKILNFLAEHNISLDLHDQLVKLMKNIFPDSAIGQNLALIRPNTTAICNNVLRKSHKEELAAHLKTISKPAPFWESTAVVNGEFVQLKSTDFLGKYLVFFFYPLDFTFVCPTEILAFSDRVEEFKKINTEVVACSVDSHFTHLAWINTPRKEGGLGKINIPLLSDITHGISRDYGVFLDELGHTLRGLFIIDPKGTVRQITMNDLPVGRSVDETLRLVQAFQYTDKHGEVCPAGWKPGQDTIIPNPTGKRKYFEKH